MQARRCASHELANERDDVFSSSFSTDKRRPNSILGSCGFFCSEEKCLLVHPPPPTHTQSYNSQTCCKSLYSCKLSSNTKYSFPVRKWKSLTYSLRLKVTEIGPLPCTFLSLAITAKTFPFGEKVNLRGTAFCYVTGMEVPMQRTGTTIYVPTLTNS